ncbi:MAG: hypothetical protein Kow0079_01760 [Vicingaceae bacterium]
MFLFISSGNIYATKKFGGDDKKSKITYKIKMQEGRHLYLEGNYRGALAVFRDLMKDFKNDAMINYRIGECYFGLNEYQYAVDYFQNAKNLDENVSAELYLNLGKAYHKNLQLDEALNALTQFKNTAKKKYLKNSDVDKYIAQVNFAKQAMQNPANVKIENMGKNINSRGGDYAPSFTADGKTMIFTSRRADSKGGKIDDKGDFKYFEDVYISSIDEETGEWEDASPIPGKINTEGHDAALSISPDGEYIYIYRNDGSVYIGDIFISKKSKNSGKWGEPKPLEKPINTSYFESSAYQSADGNKLYFVSEREQKKYNPQGGGDIYVAEKLSKYTYKEPVNLGPVINTTDDEISIFLHADGKTLFFSSKGHLGMGGYDIFMSKMKEDGTWSEPVNLGYPINNVGDDVHFSLSTDGKTAYYSSVREDGYGDRDIFKIDMTNYPILEGIQSKLSIVKGHVQSSDPEVTTINATLTFLDENGERAGVTTTNEDGDYFITLTGNKKYTVKVTANEHQSTSFEIDLPIAENGTHTLIKDVSLNK